MSLRALQAVFVLALCGSPVLGQTLIKDFNPTPDPTVPSSGAAPVARLPGGDALVVAHLPGTGSELWRSDGTAAGTRFLLDLNPGYRGAHPIQFVTLPSGLVMFTATTAQHGWELWKTDGTAGGTRLVRDIRPGSVGSVAVDLTVVGNDVVFLADDGVHGIEPWKSDGTAGGTVLVADVNPNGSMSNGAAQVAALGNSAFVFTAMSSTYQQWELWKSDKTATGTVKILDLPPNGLIFGPSRLVPFGNRALLEARTAAGIDEAWVTDGTPVGTFPLGAAISSDFQVVGAHAWFSGGDLEPWRTDGTVGGTGKVIDLAPGPWFVGSARPAFLGSIGANVVFTASYGGTDRDLFVSDGTVAGTVAIGPVATFGYYSSNQGTRIGSHLYFHGTDNGADGVWRTDGTAAGTSLVASVSGDSFLSTNGTILFRGQDPGTGSELWQTDGTPAGTRRLVDISNASGTLDSNVRLLTKLRDQVILSVDDAALGHQLWTTDGTTVGTRPITGFPAGVYGYGVTSTDAFLFVAVDGPGMGPDPWISDGTAGGLRQLAVSGWHPGFRIGRSVAIDDRIVFTGTTNALGSEPWISDGTTAGTRPIADLVPGSANSYPGFFHPWRGRVFFLATTPAGGSEPWVTDGTAAGTVQLTETAAGTDGLYNVYFEPAGDLLYFYTGVAVTADNELWVTNGTPIGTHKIDVVPGAAGSQPGQLTAVGDDLVFAATVGSERRLAVTDGTAAGTRILPQPSEVQIIRRIDDDTALVIVDAAGEDVGWTTDGTAAGTRLLGPMPLWSTYTDVPSNLTDDQLVLELDDPVFGRELFVTDGTAAGTGLWIDLAPESSAPSQLMRAGTRVVVVADDGVHGRELHALHLATLHDETVATFGFGCPGSGGHVPSIDVEGQADASSSAPFEIVIEDALALTPVLLALSTEPIAAPLGGCTLWTGGTVLFGVGAADGLGTARFALVPSPPLVGVRFVAQGFPLDPGGPLLGLLSATPGLEFVLGP